MKSHSVEMLLCVPLLLLLLYDKDHMSALRIKNTNESDPRSYEVT